MVLVSCIVNNNIFSFNSAQGVLLIFEIYLCWSLSEGPYKQLLVLDW